MPPGWQIARDKRCLWRIVISPMIPQDSPSCYHSAMCNLLTVLIHLYIYRCLTGVRRNHGVRAIVGPNGPKNDVDAVEVVTANA
jgi:hypothetical protein